MSGTTGLLNVDDIKSASSCTAGCTIPYCPVEMSSITEERCKEITSDPRYNGSCIKHKECISRWKVCPSCLRFGEMKKMGHVGPVCCAKGKNLCGFHLLYGAGAHRSISEMEEELKKYEDGLAALQHMRSAPQKTSKDVSVKKHDRKSSDESGRINLIKQAAEKAHVSEKDIAMLSEDTAEEIQLPASAVLVEEKDKPDTASDETVIIIEERISEDVPDVGETILLNEVDEDGIITQAEATVISTVFDANWEEILPYKRQPRKRFGATRMQELACSIGEKGQI